MRWMRMRIWPITVSEPCVLTEVLRSTFPPKATKEETHHPFFTMKFM
jgi:hypothetical protein